MTRASYEGVKWVLLHLILTLFVTTFVSIILSAAAAGYFSFANCFHYLLFRGDTIRRCFRELLYLQSENIYMQWEAYKTTNCSRSTVVGSYLHCVSFCVNLHSTALEKAVSASALLGLVGAWTQGHSKALERFVRSHQRHSALPVRHSTPS